MTNNNKYKAIAEIHGYILGVYSKEGKNGEYRILSVKSGFEGNSNFPILLPKKFWGKISQEDAGSQILLQAYMNDSDFGINLVLFYGEFI